MRKTWFDDAWEDYLYWQGQDKKTLRKINRLILDIERNGYRGAGKPEPFKEYLSGWWSVRIDEKNRIVFRISGEGDGRILEISQCGSHYRDKSLLSSYIVTHKFAHEIISSRKIADNRGEKITKYIQK